jgi:transcription elongation factor Elf1
MDEEDDAMPVQVNRGFDVHCPLCGDHKCITVRVHNVELLICNSCDGEIEVLDLKGRVDEWQRLLEWLEAAPGRPTR